MYRLKEDWREFYEETDPDRRRELFETLAMEAEDDGANAYRKEFLDLRHTDPKDKNRKVDRFLWNIVNLPVYLGQKYLFRSGIERDGRRIIRELGLEHASEKKKKKRAAAYWEYRNAAARYLATCEDAGYARRFFGTMSSSKEEKLARTASDLYSITVTLPAKFGREKEMEIFIRAMQDAFLSYSKDAEKAWIEAGGRALR